MFQCKMFGSHFFIPICNTNTGKQTNKQKRWQDTLKVLGTPSPTKYKMEKKSLTSSEKSCTTAGSRHVFGCWWNRLRLFLRMLAPHLWRQRSSFTNELVSRCCCGRRARRLLCTVIRVDRCMCSQCKSSEKPTSIQKIFFFVTYAFLCEKSKAKPEVWKSVCLSSMKKTFLSVKALRWMNTSGQKHIQHQKLVWFWKISA